MALGFFSKGKYDEYVELVRIVDGYYDSPIPFIFAYRFKQEIVKVIERGRLYEFAQICHRSSSKEELEVSLVLRIHENFLVILDYSYGEKTARLTGKKFFFSRSAIDKKTWKVFPLFDQPNSTQVCGIHIS